MTVKEAGFEILSEEIKSMVDAGDPMPEIYMLYGIVMSVEKIINAGQKTAGEKND